MLAARPELAHTLLPQLVKILLGAATLSFVLAFFEDGEEGARSRVAA